MSYASDLVDVWTAIRSRYGDEAAKALVEDVKRVRKEREDRAAGRARAFDEVKEIFR